MILMTDAKLKAALAVLKTNPNLTTAIAELELPVVTVQVKVSATGGGSTTESVSPHNFFQVTIDAKADDDLAKRKWGITGTTELNSLAHELGHVYWAYLRFVKAKPHMLDGKPATVTSDHWDEMLSEMIARRFDLYIRPMGTAIPIIDRNGESVVERLDFTPFPFTLFK